MSLKIKELPVTERPYEKLEMYGEKCYQIPNYWQ